MPTLNYEPSPEGGRATRAHWIGGIFLLSMYLGCAILFAAVSVIAVYRGSLLFAAFILALGTFLVYVARGRIRQMRRW